MSTLENITSVLYKARHIENFVNLTFLNFDMQHIFH